MTIEIPGYQILGELGTGAMGVVYLALQESLQRQVALKVMDAALTKDQSFQERFFIEGRIVAQLQHPNIVTVHDIGRYNSHFYMDLEYASGGSLSRKIRQGLPEQRAVSLTLDIAGALAYAHRRDFVHRDIKPPNILFREDGTALLSDFGIAKCLTSDNQLTVVGMSIGTPNYMSPEQAMGLAVTPRSDLYSLGVTFYEMLTGERPYKADSAYAVAAMHVNAPLPVLPDRYRHFQPVIEGCMAKDPSERFESGDALIAALQAAQVAYDDQNRTVVRVAGGVAANRSSPGTDAQLRPHSPAKRTRVLAGTAASIVLAAAGFAIWQWQGLDPVGPENLPTSAVSFTTPESLIERHFTALEKVGTAYAALAVANSGEPDAAIATERAELAGKMAQVIEKAQAYGNQALTQSLLKRALKVLPDSTRLVDLQRSLQRTNNGEPLTEQQNQAVMRLLTSAERHLNSGRFTLPEGANAYELFQRVLVIDRDNARALRGLRAMASVFEQTAREKMAREELKGAIQDVEIGLMILPGHTGLRALSQEFAIR
jgi:serine/threonine-protein kinase PpkA